MPIQNREDAVEVEERIGRIFAAAPGHRAAEVRGLFAEVLDFNTVAGQVSLADAVGSVHLADAADRIAELDGVHVLYVAMPPSDTDRVRKAEVDAAAKLLANQLGDDLLLVFTNPSANQLHVILPSFAGSRPTLRRLVVDRDLPRRTAVQQVSNIYWNHQASGSIRTALDQAFDVEPVTRDFFNTYYNIFNYAKSEIGGFGDRDQEQEMKHVFTQTLFNRLMFVYFLSRKGWLAFNGNTDYLNALWRDYGSLDGNKNFYTARLENVFFAGLNNPQSIDLMHNNPVMYRIIGGVKFLNGGLFEKAPLDDREGVTVPDAVIHRILTGLFDRFNFTVMESTPLDIEVTVDPEMLGKVFEELVTERHASGAYYTPRPVVSFMCREALKGYLEGKDTSASAEAIAAFVDRHDTQGIGVAEARRISQALSEVTVVDPACGSGAYLLGMMQELIELQNTLYNVGVDPKSLYDLKLEIIQRNLYGVDLDGFAVNIAMLRLWLSLAIDYGGEQPEPLPNLDFKVLKGDSLLGPDPSAGLIARNDETAQVHLSREPARLERLDDLKGQFMRATRSEDKARLREEIEAIKEELWQAMGDAAPVPEEALDWRVDLAEVLGWGQGFDVVIANPPYGIAVNDQRSAAIGHNDSYTNFFGLAIDLAPNGLIAYITPTSWETGERFQKFRQYFFRKMALQSVVNLPYDVFDTPYVDTAITIGAIGKPEPSEFRLATLDKRAELDLTQIAEQLTTANWSAVSGDAGLRVPLLDWAAGLFGRVVAKSSPFGKITSSKRGIEAYQFEILSRSKSNALPFFTGQVQRYEVQPSLARNFVVVNDRESQYHEGPRIWTRRIVSRANRLMSALAYDDFVVKKDIHVSKPNFDDPHRLDVLLAILNSSLISFLYLSRSAAAVKDDFRQVTLSGLRELPIIFPESETTAELAQLVAARERQDGNIADLEHRMDAIIYRTYGVTEAEQEAIEEWLARPG